MTYIITKRPTAKEPRMFWWGPKTIGSIDGAPPRIAPAMWSAQLEGCAHYETLAEASGARMYWTDEERAASSINLLSDVPALLEADAAGRLHREHAATDRERAEKAERERDAAREDARAIHKDAQRAVMMAFLRSGATSTAAPGDFSGAMADILDHLERKWDAVTKERDELREIERVLRQHRAESNAALASVIRAIEAATGHTGPFMLSHKDGIDAVAGMAAALTAERSHSDALAEALGTLLRESTIDGLALLHSAQGDASARDEVERGGKARKQAAAVLATHAARKKDR